MKRTGGGGERAAHSDETRRERERTRVHVDTVEAPLVARVRYRDPERLVVQQALPFLRLGNGVSDEQHRRGRIEWVHVVFDGDTPSLVVEMTYDRIQPVPAQPPRRDGTLPLRLGLQPASEPPPPPAAPPPPAVVAAPLRHAGLPPAKRPRRASRDATVPFGLPNEPDAGLTREASSTDTPAVRFHGIVARLHGIVARLDGIADRLVRTPAVARAMPHLVRLVVAFGQGVERLAERLGLRVRPPPR